MIIFVFCWINVFWVGLMFSGTVNKVDKYLLFIYWQSFVLKITIFYLFDGYFHLSSLTNSLDFRFLNDFRFLIIFIFIIFSYLYLICIFQTVSFKKVYISFGYNVNLFNVKNFLFIDLFHLFNKPKCMIFFSVQGYAINVNHNGGELWPFEY